MAKQKSYLGVGYTYKRYMYTRSENEDLTYHKSLFTINDQDFDWMRFACEFGLGFYDRGKNYACLGSKAYPDNLDEWFWGNSWTCNLFSRFVDTWGGDSYMSYHLSQQAKAGKELNNEADKS